MKPYRFAESAEQRLDEIFSWSYEKFGRQKAHDYLDEILRTCDAIASGTAHTQSCNILMQDSDKTNMRFARSGRHMIIFEEQPTVFGIIDLLHSSSDLGSKLSKFGIYDN